MLTFSKPLKKKRLVIMMCSLCSRDLIQKFLYSCRISTNAHILELNQKSKVVPRINAPLNHSASTTTLSYGLYIAYICWATSPLPSLPLYQLQNQLQIYHNSKFNFRSRSSSRTLLLFTSTYLSYHFLYHSPLHTPWRPIFTIISLAVSAFPNPFNSFHFIPPV